MARIRSANPCAPKDEDVAAMSIWARYVWAYLPCHADREGRLKDSPFTLKAEILPGDTDVDMDALLAELAAKRHIIRYQVDGRRFIQIRTFARHQAPHTREVQSVIPPMPGEGNAEVMPEHDLGSAEAPPRLASVSSSPSIPVPDPVLVSPQTLLASDPDPERAHVRKLWAAHRWLRAFEVAWCGKYQRLAYGGGTSDAVATGQLADQLEALPAPERLAAQERAGAMIGEYLGDESPAVMRARHPWAWFVTRFTGLRVPVQVPAAKPAETFAERDARLRREAEQASAKARAEETARALAATEKNVARLRQAAARAATPEELAQLRRGAGGQ